MLPTKSIYDYYVAITFLNEIKNNCVDNSYIKSMSGSDVTKAMRSDRTEQIFWSKPCQKNDLFR